MTVQQQPGHLGQELCNLALATAGAVHSAESCLEHDPETAKTLAGGYPGLVVLYTECYQSSSHEMWLERAIQSWERLVQLCRRSPVRGGGVFDGLGGVLFAARYLAPFYPSAQALFNAVTPLLVADLSAQAGNTDPNPPPTSYDVISGVCGLVAAQLGPETQFLAETILQRLFTPSGEFDPHGLFTSTDETASRAEHASPRLVIDLGLAHGMAGAVAALAISQHDLPAPGQAAQWLCEHVMPSHAANNTVGRLVSSQPGHHIQQNPRYPSWCYGASGVFAALGTTAHATHNPALGRIATKMLIRSVGSHAAQLADPVHGTGICHGCAGPLLMLGAIDASWCAEQEAFQIRSLRKHLLHELLRQLPPTWAYSEATDGLGLLSGAAGAALTLLDVAEPGRHEWKRLFFTPMHPSVEGAPL